MKLKKLLSVLLVLTMVLSLGACGASEEGSASTENNTSAGTEATTETTNETTEVTEVKEPITLTMWDVMASDEDSRVIRPIIEDWNAANPDVQIVREGFDVENYKMKLKTAMAANEAPDLIYGWGAGFMEPFVDAGKLLPLDDYLTDETMSQMYQGAATYAQFDGTTYALPYSMWFAAFYCNTELFDQYGVKIPETYDELLEAVAVFRENGVGPIGVGAKDRWTSMFYHNILALRTAGADAVNEALSGTGSYDTPEMLEAAQKLAELVEAGAFIDGAMGLNYDEFVAMFKQGQIPMMLQGTWVAGELELDEYPIKGKAVVRKFPVFDGGAADTEYLGGSIDVYMVNANTADKEAAVRALEYIATEMSRRGYEAGTGLPVFEAEFDESSVDRTTKEAVNLVKDATGFTLAWDTFLVGEDAQLHLNLVQEIFAGIRTPEDFVKEMQTINEKSE